MSTPINPMLHISQIKLSYTNKVKREDRIAVNSPEDAAIILRCVWDENKMELLEEFKILLLDAGKRCLGVADISQGGVDSCPVDPKIIFATALLARATGIILAHNHPSGALNPSNKDILITKEFVAAGKLLNITIEDHIILATEGYCSMAEQGFIYQPNHFR